MRFAEFLSLCLFSLFNPFYLFHRSSLFLSYVYQRPNLYCCCYKDSTYACDDPLLQHIIFCSSILHIVVVVFLQFQTCSLASFLSIKSFLPHFDFWKSFKSTRCFCLALNNMTISLPRVKTFGYSPLNILKRHLNQFECRSTPNGYIRLNTIWSSEICSKEIFLFAILI